MQRLRFVLTFDVSFNYTWVPFYWTLFLPFLAALHSTDTMNQIKISSPADLPSERWS